MPKVKQVSKPNGTRSRNALTVESRENQLVALAYDLLEQRLRDGTATSQEVTTLIKYGSTRGRLEKEIMEEERKLKQAKTEALAAQKRSEELYAEAIAAMRRYGGQPDEDEEYDEDIF